jgi:NADP-dependent 3-hydroxy acid dehydrogenase YdfG
MTPELSGRTAVVTGASSGIGAATATALAAAGARVALLARRADRTAKLAADTGGLAVSADVTDPTSLAAAAAAVRAGLGPVDLAVANAGVMLGAPFATADPAEWQSMIDTNVTGLLATARTFLPDLLAAAEAGRPADLVLVGSIASRQQYPGYAVYSATKAAVLAVARGLRQEHGPRGLRVRLVEPGLTASELGDEMSDAAAREYLAEFRRTLTPVPASDLADVIAWTAAAPPRLNVAELVVVPTAQG